MKSVFSGACGKFGWPWQNSRVCLEAFKSYCPCCFTETKKCHQIYAAATTNSK